MRTLGRLAPVLMTDVSVITTPEIVEKSTALLAAAILR